MFDTAPSVSGVTVKYTFTDLNVFVSIKHVPVLC